MSNDVYNLIYCKLEEYRGKDYYENRAKIASELHDALQDLINKHLFLDFNHIP